MIILTFFYNQANRKMKISRLLFTDNIIGRSIIDLSIKTI
jgi:hypothetical protein